MSARFRRIDPASAGAVVIALVVMLPLLGRGFVLSYDMVFVPRYHFSLEMLGISEQLPRSVPVEALLAVIARVIATDILEKLILVAVFVLGAVGAARLVPSDRGAARLTAGVFYVWNPFVYERLIIGHWALLLSYATLPWVARAAIDLRLGKPRAAPRLGLWLAAAGIVNPYGGVITAALALVVVGAPPWRDSPNLRRSLLIAFGLVALVNLPWLVPSLARPGGLPSSARWLEAFRARSDSPLHLVGSLLSLGGMWNTDLVPPGRSTWAWVPSFTLILVVVAIGWRVLLRRSPEFVATGLLLVAAIGLVCSIGVSFPGLGRAYRWIALHAPGGGLLRDSQKFVCLLALALAVGFGTGVGRLLDAVTSGRALTRVMVVAAMLLPVSLAPTLAWGAGGELWTVSYPDSWHEVRQVMASDPASGSVLVLPWHQYIPLSWNDGRITLDPASRFFTRQAITPGRVDLRSGPLPPEYPLGKVADRLIDSDRPFKDVMASLGSRYLLLLKEAPLATLQSRLIGLDRLLDAPDLALFRSSSPSAQPHLFLPPVIPVLTVDAFVAAAIIAMALTCLRSGAAALRLVSFDRPADQRGASE